jgi:hypothetical protein
VALTANAVGVPGRGEILGRFVDRHPRQPEPNPLIASDPPSFVIFRARAEPDRE